MKYLKLIIILIINSSCGRNPYLETSENGSQITIQRQDSREGNNSTITNEQMNLKFASNRELNISFDKITCPVELSSKKSCFHTEHKRKLLVLDPGHDLTLSSLRNGRHDEVHEGRSNMAVSILTKLMIEQCIGYDQASGTGFKPENIFLSHYPGEVYYGDYVYGRKASGRSSNKVSHQGGQALYNHINKLLKINGYKPENSTVVSVHADAPDYSSSVKRKSEYPAVIFRKLRKSSALLAAEIYDKLSEITSKYYSASQIKRFEPKKVSSTKYKFPNVTYAGTQNGRSTYKIGSLYHDYRTWKRQVAQVLRTGTTKSSSSGLSPRLNNTEVVLVEGYFMDSLGVGSMIQRELSGSQAKLLKFSKKTESDNSLIPIIFKKGRIKITSSSGSSIKYRISDSGTRQDGLKFTQFHIDYAKSIILGLVGRYQCRL